MSTKGCQVLGLIALTFLFAVNAEAFDFGELLEKGQKALEDLNGQTGDTNKKGIQDLLPGSNSSDGIGGLINLGGGVNFNNHQAVVEDMMKIENECASKAGINELFSKCRTSCESLRDNVEKRDNMTSREREGFWKSCNNFYVTAKKSLEGAPSLNNRTKTQTYEYPKELGSIRVGVLPGEVEGTFSHELLMRNNLPVDDGKTLRIFANFPNLGMGKWVSLVNLSLVGTLEDPRALYDFVENYMDINISSKYIISKTKARSTSSRSKYSGWVGTNEFESERSFNKFVADYGDKIKQWAENTPKEFYVVGIAQFRWDYDSKRNGYQFLAPPDTSGAGKWYRLLVNWDMGNTPNFISMSKAEAESFLSLFETKGLAYCVRKMEVIPLSKIRDINGPGIIPKTGNPQGLVKVVSMEIFADAGLTKRIYSFDKVFEEAKVAEEQKEIDFKAFQEFVSTPSEEICAEFNKPKTFNSVSDFQIVNIGFNIPALKAHQALLCQGFQILEKGSKPKFSGTFDQESFFSGDFRYDKEGENRFNQQVNLLLTERREPNNQRMVYGIKYYQRLPTTVAFDWNLIRAKIIERFGNPKEDNPGIGRMGRGSLGYSQDEGESCPCSLTVKGNNNDNSYYMQLISNLNQIGNNENKKIEDLKKPQAVTDAIDF